MSHPAVEKQAAGKLTPKFVRNQGHRRMWTSARKHQLFMGEASTSNIHVGADKKYKRVSLHAY